MDTGQIVVRVIQLRKKSVHGIQPQLDFEKLKLV
jgi:hypothetical protein